MLRKLAILYHTLRQLRFIQIYYQIWYRIKRKLFQHTSYKPVFLKAEVNVLPLPNAELIAYQHKFLGNNTFNFLNRRHTFHEKGIDWNFNAYGKLWNYNLQYFDWLLSPSLNPLILKEQVQDFSEKLLARQIALEPYPVSLRLINWGIFFSMTPGITEEQRKAYSLQYHFLRNNPEYHLLANHLLENYIALPIAALYTNDLASLPSFLRKLEVILEDQIHADGAHFERSPMYHCILLSRLLILLEIYTQAQHNHQAVNFIKETISRMLSWLKNFSFQNQEYALMQDSAPGIAPHVSYLWASAAKLSVKAADLPLSDSRYRKITTKELELLIDAGQIAPSYQPGHAHSGHLSFCLQFRDQPVFVDTGISTYEANATRLYERSTSAHNTVNINGSNQSNIWSSFRCAERATVKLLRNEQNYVQLAHDGYMSRYSLLHQRSFEVSGNAIIITDNLEQASGKKTVSTPLAVFQCAPGITPLMISKNKWQLKEQLYVEFQGAISVEVITSEKLPDGYNRFQPNQVINVHFNNKLTTTITLS